MSGEEAPDGEVEPVGEPRQMSERTAKAIVLVVAVGGLWGLVAVFPWVAYVIVGVLGTLGWQKAHGWISRRGSSSEETEPGGVTEVELVEALHGVAGPNVFLADLAAELGLPKDEARALLEQHQIRVRRAVRNGDDTGVGIHRNDLPPLPRGAAGGRETNVDLQPTSSADPGKGLRVETIGQAGAIIRDPADLHRRHRVQ